MTHQTTQNKYDYLIKEKEWRPNKENPEKVILKIETSLKDSLGNEEVFSRNFNLKPKQLERRNEYISSWIDEVHKNMEETTPSIEDTGKVVNAKDEL